MLHKVVDYILKINIMRRFSSVCINNRVALVLDILSFVYKKPKASIVREALAYYLFLNYGDILKDVSSVIQDKKLMQEFLEAVNTLIEEYKKTHKLTIYNK